MSWVNLTLLKTNHLIKTIKTLFQGSVFWGILYHIYNINWSNIILNRNMQYHTKFVWFSSERQDILNISQTEVSLRWMTKRNDHSFFFPSKESFKISVSALCCGKNVQDLSLSFEYWEQNILWVVSFVNVGLDMHMIFWFDACGCIDMNFTGIWV